MCTEWAEVLNIKMEEDWVSEKEEITCTVLVFLCRTARGIEMQFIFHEIFLVDAFILVMEYFLIYMLSSSAL